LWSDFQATITKGKEVSHPLQFFLAVITFGLWLIVWLGFTSSVASTDG
jgi:hypothetical protein